MNGQNFPSNGKKIVMIGARNVGYLLVVIGKELFNTLKEEHGSNFQPFIIEKTFPLAGDVSCEYLGIHDIILREKLWNEIDFIANVAGATKFYERYDHALAINTFGAKNVLDFAKKCKNLRMLLHVSTAYVSSTQTSRTIQEKSCCLDEALKDFILGIEEELRVVEEKRKELQSQNSTKDVEKATMRQLGLTRAKHFGWPNTYAFTKAVGEMLLEHMKGDLPLSIIRPTIITSIYRDPLPGWIEGIRTLDSFIIAYVKGQLPCMLRNPKIALDLIPGDMVANAMIGIMVTPTTKSSESIYHICSSSANPITCFKLEDYIYQYFVEKATSKTNRRTKMVRKPLFLNSMACFHGYMTVRYGLPLKALWLMNVASCGSFSSQYNKLNRKYKLSMLLANLYMPYIFFKGIFDDSNMKKIRMEVIQGKIEDKLFDFDPKHIEWEEYIKYIHVPGLLKYASY